MRRPAAGRLQELSHPAQTSMACQMIWSCPGMVPMAVHISSSSSSSRDRGHRQRPLQRTTRNLHVTSRLQAGKAPSIELFIHA